MKKINGLLDRLLGCGGPIVAGLLLSPQQGDAQDVVQRKADTQTTEAGRTLGTVVVTATRRETDAQSTPIALTALSGESLTAQGAFTLEDFAATVPGLQYQSFGGPGLSRVTIRGLSSVSGAATVSVYIDETPVTSPVSQQTQPDFSLVDIERVEVLRGPQGTLWGEGAVGGTIRYITRKPDPTAFHASVASEAGTIDDDDRLFGASAVINIPIVPDQAAVRLVGYYRNEGGWIDNTRAGIDNANDAETVGFRASLSFLPSDRFSVLASLFYDRFEGGALPVQPNPGALESAVEDFRDEHYVLGSVKLGFHLEGADLVSVSSYLDRPRAILLGTPSAGLDGAFGDPDQTLVTAGTIDIKGYTQELRLVSNTDRPLQYSVGGFYKNLERDFFVALAMDPDFPAGTFIPRTGDLFNISSEISYEQWAAFGEATWSINEKLAVLAGLRYTHETVEENDVNNNGAFAFPPLIPPQQLLSASTPYDALTPKLTVSYDVDSDVMFYGTAAQGFRSGGNNMQFPGSPFSSYDEDSCWNYELGWKTSLAGDVVRFNGALYYIDWKDFQALGDPVPGSALGGTAVENIGDAHSAGIELELSARLADGLDFTATGNWNEAELDKDTNSTSNDRGHTLPQVPKFTFSSTINYVFPVTARVDARLGATVQHVGERYQDIGNTTRFDDYTLIGLQAGVLVQDDWAVTLFADNVGDETVVYDISGEVSGTYVNRPRTIGLRVSKNF